MRNLTITRCGGITKTLLLGLFTAALGAASMGGCPGAGGGVLSVLPFGQISAVQLFDEPAFTVAFSVTNAVSNPANVSKVNWVFGDGGGFVEGAAGQTSITHQYDVAGNYQITAFVFGPSGFADQINGSVTVINSGGTSGGGGSTTQAPAKATGFIPANNAEDIAVKSTLTWTSGARAASHDVYLGTDKAGVTAADHSDAANFVGNVSSPTFDPGGLSTNTTYFWRIDEVNAGGTTKGDVMTFRTAKAPLKAKDPVPVNGSVSARVDQVLRWAAGLRATTHDVYFGTVMASVDAATTDTLDIFQGNQTGLSFDPEDEDADVVGQLLAGTAYFWRIDEVGPGGTTKGDVWTFTTHAPPSAITSPVPADQATDLPVDLNLTWDGSSSLESFDVYFGTGELDVMLATRTSPEFKGNRTTKTFGPGILLPNLDYFWRIDTLGPGGTSKGFTMKFTTAALPPAVTTPFAPADQAVDIHVDTNLTWTAGVGAATKSYDVYLSTDSAEVSNLAASALKLNLPFGTNIYNPPQDLLANTNYYWRIVSKGPGGKTNGPILAFRTGLLALAAEDPSPANNEVGVAPNTMLGWTAGMNSASHDVYFGTSQNAVTNATDMDAEFKGNSCEPSVHPPLGDCADTTFDPGALNANKDYFWRIDEVASGGKTKGPTWKFTTGPGQAITPVPTNGALQIDIGTVLSWTAGAGATSYDVYFGTDHDQVFNASRLAPPTPSDIYRGNQTDTSYDPPEPLNGNLFYFWRVDSVTTTATTKGIVWSFKTAVGKAGSPIPADRAINQDLNVDLQWSAGAAAITHDVYFGMSFAAVSNADPTTVGIFQRNQAGLSFDPGPLTANVDYFWRIDEVAADNTKRTGDVWTFKTVAPVPPAQAANPNPANGAMNVDSATVLLSWGAVTGATGYDVFLGTANPPPTQVSTNQAGTSFAPGALLGNTTYFWRVDSKNSAGTTTGIVWTFKTVAPVPPAQAANPNPANEATNVDSATALLSWGAVSGATGYDVFFGTANPPTTQVGTNQAGTSIAPGALVENTTYFWRVDSKNSAGTTTGVVWSFKTFVGKAANPIPVDRATDQDLNVDLQWTAGAGAATHDVYFGASFDAVNNATIFSPEFQVNQAGTTFDPGLLSASTDLFWRIDEVAADSTKRKGDVWQFSTLAPPAQASNPSPPDGLFGVNPNSVTLSWSAAAGATGYDVYFGTDNPPLAPPVITNQPGTSFPAGTLQPGTFYFWRVDAKNAAGTTTGAVWSFITGS